VLVADAFALGALQFVVKCPIFKQLQHVHVPWWDLPHL
jgi:hypothetical protein